MPFDCGHLACRRGMNPSKNLSLLLALSSNPNNTAPVPSGDPDPAIQGATKKGATVQLGFDSSIAPTVQWAAELKVALDNAADDFAALQGDVRDYGAAKRQAYNAAYGASVVTVKIPYLVAGEEKFCAVTCSNRYAVDQEMIHEKKAYFGATYPKLFVETTQKTLKPDMEVLLKGIPHRCRPQGRPGRRRHGHPLRDLNEGLDDGSLRTGEQARHGRPPGHPRPGVQACGPLAEVLSRL